MAATSPSIRDSYTADLSAALEVAANSTTAKHKSASSNIFDYWSEFCAQLGCAPSLSDVPTQDGKISHLLVFGLRYRLFGQKGHSVRADTVKDALTAVGQGISDLGQRDPRKQVGSEKLHPLLSSFIKGMRDQDDPASRSYPVNVTILRHMLEVLDTDDAEYGRVNMHTILLCIVAFWWLLRPAEYLHSTDPDARSQAFLFKHIHFTIDGAIYNGPSAPLNDENDLFRITYATLEFSDQKNAVRGEQVGHKPNKDPFFCPAKALGRLVMHLRKHKAPADTPIHMHYNNHPQHRCWYPTKSTNITNGLRWSAKSLEPQTGIPPHLISARSLRPGGATALLCANIDSDAIQLLGRWKSDAMLRYLRIQAAAHAHNYSQRMLDSGSFTFHPTSYQEGGLPNQAPAAIAALLAHEELYAD